MIDKLLAADPANVEWIERASNVLQRDVREHYHASNVVMFARNRDVQVGVFLANHLHWQMLHRAGLRADYSAGLSLGEYNHLVHIGALEFDAALRLVDARGRAYDNGPRGKMVALFPSTAAEVEQALGESVGSASVWIAMVNTPGQTVLSGEAAAVDMAATAVADHLGIQSVVIEEALPMHSPLFRGVGEVLGSALESAPWTTPSKPYLPNTTGVFEQKLEPAVFVDRLSRHVWSLVRWRESMETLARDGAVTACVEAGPKSVLTGMFRKNWLSPRRWSTDVAENIEATVATIVRELSRDSA